MEEDILPSYLIGEKEGLLTQERWGHQDIKKDKAEEETEVLTLIDSRNGFNEISRLVMMWTVRYHWPSGGRLSLN